MKKEQKLSFGQLLLTFKRLENTFNKK